jgi:hypothetical protein
VRTSCQVCKYLAISEHWCQVRCMRCELYGKCERKKEWKIISYHEFNGWKSVKFSAEHHSRPDEQILH